jgi:hypothetical protein
MTSKCNENKNADAADYRKQRDAQRNCGSPPIADEDVRRPVEWLPVLGRAEQLDLGLPQRFGQRGAGFQISEKARPGASALGGNFQEMFLRLGDSVLLEPQFGERFIHAEDVLAEFRFRDDVEGLLYLLFGFAQFAKNMCCRPIAVSVVTVRRTLPIECLRSSDCL